jgi:PPM family protein phosphatase
VTYHLKFAAISDVGRYRKDNQDSGYAGPHLLAVCDGVGGAARGDIASATALAQIKRLDSENIERPDLAVTAAVQQAHEAIATLVEEEIDLSGTSTTATFGFYQDNVLTVAHVGDSRAYLLRAGEIHQLTHDHTFVQTLLDEGRISEEEARTHPQRNLILKAIDGLHDAGPDVVAIELELGDRLLFCSDGVCTLRDDEIGMHLTYAAGLEEAASDLVGSSLDAGSTDNVTVVVAEVTSQKPELAPVVVGAAATRLRPVERTSAPLRGVRPLRFRGTATAVETHTELPAEIDFAISSDPLDEETQRYAPLAPSRFNWLRLLGVWMVLVGIGWASLSAAWWWSQQQYFVGEEDGQVTIFRGLDSSLLGWSLATAVEASDVDVDRLSPTEATTIRDGLPATSLADARDIVDRFGSQQTPKGTGGSP